MPNTRIDAMAAMSTLGFAAFFLGISPAQGDPEGCPTAAIVDDSACSVTLASVTANSTDGTITGTPVGGQNPITLAGQSDAYLRSAGFGSTVPDSVQQWDAAIDRVTNVDPSDPGWYGQAKAAAFLPRQLNELATQFPPNTIVARFVLDDSNPVNFRLLSIQPVGQ
ncbi:hypothetical protein BH09ACT8_BH09ACT8_25960 [soil metagenome]